MVSKRTIFPKELEEKDLITVCLKSDLHFWDLLIIYLNMIYYDTGHDCKYLNIMSVKRSCRRSEHLRVLGWEKREKSSCKPCLFSSSPSKYPVANSLAMFVESKLDKY